MKIVKRNRVRGPFEGIAAKEPALESISVKNFKSFGDWVEIPLRPVTLIFGKNSAGKSSALHSILWLRDILPFGNLNLRFLSKGGDFVDLGGLHEYLFKSLSKKTEDIGFKITLRDDDNYIETFLREKIGEIVKYYQKSESIDENGQNLLSELYKNSLFEDILTRDTPNLIEMEVNFDLRKIPKNKTINNINTQPNINLNLNGKTVFRFTANEDPYEQSKGINQDETDEDNIRYSLTIGEKVKDLLFKIINQINKKSYRDITKNDETSRSLVEMAHRQLESKLRWHSLGVMQVGFKIFTRYFPRNRFIRYLDKSSEEKTAEVELSNPTNKCYDLIAFQLINLLFFLFRKKFVYVFKNLNYFAAYRNYPSRFLFENSSELKQGFDPYGSESVKNIFKNRQILRSIDQACRKLGSNFFVKVSNKYAALFGKTIKIVHAKNSKDLSFRDIGFGWSQVFPVLSEILSDQSSLLMVEQPELHLHPQAQSDLMEIIVEQVYAQRKRNSKKRRLEGLDLNNPIILEAHSEQMVIRLLKLIGEKKLKPDDCAILYIDHDGETSSIKRISIDEQGNIGNQWPGGFFESAFKDFERDK